MNRYAGKQYTSSQASKGQGTLFVKGIEVERRDVPRFVRKICKQALYDILIENDVSRALENCKNSIRLVVSGKWSLYEYIMTGVRSLHILMSCMKAVDSEGGLSIAIN